MFKRIAVLFALCALALVVVTSCSCTQTGVAGNIAGQVVDSNGNGIGYMSVVLIDVESGDIVQQQNAEDRGNYFFKSVKAGLYTIKLYDVSGNEIPVDPVEFKLGMGRTRNETIKMLPVG